MKLELEIDQHGAKRVKVGKKKMHLPAKWTLVQQTAFLNALKRKLRTKRQSAPKQAIPVVTAIPPQVPAELIRSWVLNESFKQPQAQPPAAVPPIPPLPALLGPDAPQVDHPPPLDPTYVTPVGLKQLDTPAKKAAPKTPSKTTVKPEKKKLSLNGFIEQFATPMVWRGHVRSWAKSQKIEIKDGAINEMSPVVAFKWLKENNAPIVQTFLSEYQNQGGGALEPDQNGFRGLSNLDIDKIMKRYSAYVGTLPFDGLKLILPKLEAGQVVATVMNTQKMGQPGQHWFALLIDPIKSKSVEFYDSTGHGIPTALLSDIKRVVDKVSPHAYLKLKENKIIRQGDSNDCGFFSMKFLMDRFRGIPFPECTGYDDSVKGQKDIEEFKHKPLFKYLL